MGWNSWNVFHENINEKQIKEIADIMVSSGMRDAGYIYLNLDDNWMHTKRDANGDLQAHPTAFPSGMKALADYIHSKGLKFGVYGDRGKRTCHHYNAKWDSENGSYMHEEQDAKKFAEWGVDYLKYDNCDPAPGSDQQKDYERMRDALLKSGRDIVFSICAWEYKDWMPKTGNLWRTTGDISNSWETAANSYFFRGVINIVDLNEKYYKLAGPGHWNDPDMLEVGNGVLTIEESKSQLTLWSIMASPMLTGSDLRKMSNEIKDLYLNAEMIAVNQDSAGIAGHRLSANNGKEIWTRPLGGEDTGVMAVALLNRNKNSETIELKFEDLGLKGDVTIRDIWQKKDLGIKSGSISAEVPSHGVAFLKISAKIEPQAPFGEKAIALPGIIQAEDYDKGSSGLAYSDNDFENKGGKYRDDGVDIVECENADAAAENCYAIGYTNAGEWVEYTVNVATAGEYNIFARVASGADNSGFRLFMDDKAISDSVVVPNGGDWDTYSTIKVGTVKLDAGEQILKLAITGTYVNIDYLEFKSVTANETNKDSTLTIAKQPVLNLNKSAMNQVLVFNMNGSLLGEISLQQVGDVVSVRTALKQAGYKNGTYIIRSKNNAGFLKSMKVGLYE